MRGVVSGIQPIRNYLFLFGQKNQCKELLKMWGGLLPVTISFLVNCKSLALYVLQNSVKEKLNVSETFLRDPNDRFYFGTDFFSRVRDVKNLSLEQMWYRTFGVFFLSDLTDCQKLLMDAILWLSVVTESSYASKIPISFTLMTLTTELLMLFSTFLLLNYHLTWCINLLFLNN